MVLEIAQIDVKPGLEAEFEAGVAKAAPIFRRAKGCRGGASALHWEAEPLWAFRTVSGHSGRNGPPLLEESEAHQRSGGPKQDPGGKEQWR